MAAKAIELTSTVLINSVNKFASPVSARTVLLRGLFVVFICAQKFHFVFLDANLPATVLLCG